MVTPIYAFKANPTRYVAQIGRERFIKTVAEHAGVPEEKVRAEMTLSRLEADLDLTYHHYHKVIAHDVNGRRALKVLGPPT